MIMSGANMTMRMPDEAIHYVLEEQEDDTWVVYRMKLSPEVALIAAVFDAHPPFDKEGNAHSVLGEYATQKQAQEAVEADIATYAALRGEQPPPEGKTLH